MEVFEDLDLIKLLLTFGFIFLMWMKSFWDELQEYKAVFYPDGLNKCPPKTYTIDDDSSSVKCSSCPTCPPGEEPSPPCGSTLALKASGECVPCKTGTFSDEADSTACKVCTDCAARKVVSSCTAKRNAECKECPWRYYEDHMTHICRHCSSCCEKNSAAQMECFVSNTCKRKCSPSARIKERYFASIFNRLVANVKNSSNSTHSVSNLSGRSNVTQDMRLETPINNNPEEPSRSGRVERDTRLGVTNLEDKDKDKAVDGIEIMDLLQIPDISSDGRGKINRIVKKIQLVFTKLPPHVPPTAPDTNLGPPTPERLQPNVPPPTAPDFGKFMPLTLENQKTPKIFNGYGAVKEEQLVFTKLQPSMHPPTARDSNIGQFMPLKPEHPITSKVLNGHGAEKKEQILSSMLQPSLPPAQLMLSTPIPVKTATTSTAAAEQSRVINTDLFLSSFSGTISAFLVLGFTALILYIVYRRCVHKMSRGYNYKKISGSDKPEEEQIEDDQHDENSNEDEMKSLSNQITTEICVATQIAEDLSLSEIPQDLEDILVMMLDVEHDKPENKVFAWQKVGSAAGISRHELKLYKNEYIRQNGSPTKLLLEKLGSQGKTISFLLDVLQTPRVQLGNVAALIRHRVTRASR